MSVRSGVLDAEEASARLVDLSRAMRHVRGLAARAAAGDGKVFITGESGVGKEVVAQYIHTHSERANRPFVAEDSGGHDATTRRPARLVLGEAVGRAHAHGGHMAPRAGALRRMGRRSRLDAA